MKPSYPTRIWLFLFRLCCLLPFGAPGAVAQNDPNLQKVLSQMDSAAASFRTTQANFVWEQYWKVVNERESQKGTVYYRRAGKEIQMMADIADPPKSVIISNAKGDIHFPKATVAMASVRISTRHASSSLL